MLSQLVRYAPIIALVKRARPRRILEVATDLPRKTRPFRG
jgi:hypothetical protein